MSIRVGVIGTGIMGADHVSTLHRQISGAAVSMVADVDLGRAQGIADGISGVRATDDGFALITDPDVDAVVIASHDSTHAALAVAAVRAGKPVLCEKPLAPTVAECLQVVQAERDAVGPGGSPLISLGFMRRFDPGYVQLRAGARGRGGRGAVAAAQHQSGCQLRTGRQQRIQRHRLCDPRVRRAAMASRIADRRGQLARTALLECGHRPAGPATVAAADRAMAC